MWSFFEVFPFSLCSCLVDENVLNCQHVNRMFIKFILMLSYRMRLPFAVCVCALEERRFPPVHAPCCWQAGCQGAAEGNGLWGASNVLTSPICHLESKLSCLSISFLQLHTTWGRSHAKEDIKHQYILDYISLMIPEFTTILSIHYLYLSVP